VDNHIYFGNSLGIDTCKVQLHRCMDMNDRQLRFITNGLGGKVNGTPREDSFDITAASEVMAVVCMSRNLDDLKKRLGDIVVAYNFNGEPVTARQINAHGAMAAVLKDALKPNLVQTLEKTPVLIHGGPFANIAHGCNSIIATKTAMCLGDYVVTEAGFGADLGAEKFLDIKCRNADISPNAVVIVATVKALKYHGGMDKNNLKDENIEALKIGLSNLEKHIENIKQVYNLPAVVAVNKFYTDTQAEIDEIIKYCKSLGTNAVVADVWAKGGDGAIDLAQAVIAECEKEKSQMTFAYEINQTIEQKIISLASKIYGASNVEITTKAAKMIKEIESNGYGNLPICIAKTQYSLSDDPTLRNRPSGFKITVRGARVSAGAGFIVILTGDIMTMPGLPKVPSAEKIEVDQDGLISGLF
ncbi:MAG: formate--tetrahydrofolate ligase, partial [Oscillospiraceae bacterium]